MSTVEYVHIKPCQLLRQLPSSKHKEAILKVSAEIGYVLLCIWRTVEQWRVKQRLYVKTSTHIRKISGFRQQGQRGRVEEYSAD